MKSFDYLEGRKFCVVFVKVLDPITERVQLRCLRGRANVENGKVSVATERGNAFTVPQSALGTIAPNDGTALLKDAEFFCMVKVDDSIELVNNDGDDVVMY